MTRHRDEKLLLIVKIEKRDDRKEYASALCQERDGQRLKAVLPSGAESASGSAGDVDALRLAAVTGRTE